MRSYLIFLTFLLAILTINAQDTINVIDTHGKKQGHWIKKDKDGKKVYEGQFSNDIPYGTFK